MNIYRVFLDGIFDNPRWFREALELIAPEQIPEKTVRAIYMVLRNAYFEDGLPPNQTTFPDMVMRRYPEKVAKVLIDYIFKFESTPPEYIQFRHAIREIQYEAFDEKVRENVANALDLLKNHKRSGISDALVDGLDSFRNEGASEVDARQEAMTLLERYKEPIGPRISTGIPEIDICTGGGRAGELWLWGGYTGECKTRSMLEIAYHLIINGKNVVWIPLVDMEREEMEELFVVRHTHNFKDGGLVAQEVEMRSLSAQDYQILETTVSDWQGNEKYGKLYIWKPSRRATINTIETKLQSLQEPVQPHLVVIDYLENVGAIRKREQYRIEVLEKMVAMKRIASDFDLWILSGHQISRKGREDASKRGYYELMDLAESSGTERNASVVAWSLYTGEMKMRGVLKYGLMKARRGATSDKGKEVRADIEHGRIHFESVEE